jgi:hypothetical protein
MVRYPTIIRAWIQGDPDPLDSKSASASAERHSPTEGDDGLSDLSAYQRPTEGLPAVPLCTLLWTRLPAHRLAGTPG